MISMAEFSPLFGTFSLIGGFIFGPTRKVPFHLVEKTVLKIGWILAPVIISFVVFRIEFGKFEFSPGLSLIHLVEQLIVIRPQYFFGGAFLGLVLTLTMFLVGIAHGVFSPEEKLSGAVISPDSFRIS
jgi:hypothetical protein